MFLLLTIFNKYKIIPIFIFDGKIPVEKKELIKRRMNERLEAQKEFNLLKEKLQLTKNENKEEIMNSINILKKKIIYITKDKMNKIKNLIHNYGGIYYEAPFEADELCALLVKKQQVWACLSEDMDMLVYGCSRVLRYLSLINHTVVLYNYNQILEELNLNSNYFKEICILSGTDYNLNQNEITIFKIFKYYYQYINNNNLDKNEFYEFLSLQKEAIKIDLLLLENIKKIFNIEKQDNLNIDLEKLNLLNKFNYNNLKILLEEEGFVYV